MGRAPWIMLIHILCMIISMPRTVLCVPLLQPESKSTGILPRELLPGTDLILRTAVTLESFPPDDLTAYDLLELYRKVLVSVLQHWQSGQRDPPPYFSVTYGPFLLTFVANTMGNIIPWNVIGSFCSHMIDQTNQGYLATYNRAYWNAERNFGVYVALRFVKAIVES